MGNVVFFAILLTCDLLHDISVQVDLLKHGIPDPSSLIPAHSLSSNLGSEKENKDKVHESEEYMAAPVFVHTKWVIFSHMFFTIINGDIIMVRLKKV